MIDFYDAEYNKVYTVDSSSKKMMKAYYERMEELENNKKEIFQKSSVDVISLTTGETYLPQLVKFFSNRQKRKMLG